MAFCAVSTQASYLASSKAMAEMLRIGAGSFGARLDASLYFLWATFRQFCVIPDWGVVEYPRLASPACKEHCLLLSGSPT